MRVGDAQLGQAAAEPRHVLVEAEQLPAVDRNDLVDAVAEDEAAVEHRDLGLGEPHVFAVEVAERVGKLGVHGASAAGHCLFRGLLT
jgi:hypothetical protein